MPRPRKDVAITDTMIQAACMYDEGHSIPEIGEKLGKNPAYIRWCLRIIGVSVDEMPYVPGKKTTDRFSWEWFFATFPYKWNTACKSVMRGLGNG